MKYLGLEQALIWHGGGLNPYATALAQFIKFLSISFNDICTLLSSHSSSSISAIFFML